MERKNVYAVEGAEPTYLDIHTQVGITKHMGGYAGYGLFVGRKPPTTASP